MKMYGRVEVKLHAFLIPALDGCEWSASRLEASAALRPGKMPPPRTHWIGTGWAPEPVWTL
jgi:hypothetical protein